MNNQKKMLNRSSLATLNEDGCRDPPERKKKKRIIPTHVRQKVCLYEKRRLRILKQRHRAQRIQLPKYNAPPHRCAGPGA